MSLSAIFSYLDYYAFMVMGTISLIFVVTAFFGLFALFVVHLLVYDLWSVFTSFIFIIQDSPYLIHFAHRITWVAVSLFLTNFFADIIIFSVQEQQYQNWCSNKSRDSVDEAVTTEAGVHVAATLIVEAVSDYYNCHKLWQDELKLAIAMFIVMTICYVSCRSDFRCYKTGYLLHFLVDLLGNVSVVVRTKALDRQQRSCNRIGTRASTSTSTSTSASTGSTDRVEPGTISQRGVCNPWYERSRSRSKRGANRPATRIISISKRMVMKLNFCK